MVPRRTVQWSTLLKKHDLNGLGARFPWKQPRQYRSCKCRCPASEMSIVNVWNFGPCDRCCTTSQIAHSAPFLFGSCETRLLATRTAPARFNPLPSHHLRSPLFVTARFAFHRRGRWGFAHDTAAGIATNRSMCSSSETIACAQSGILRTPSRGSRDRVSALEAPPCCPILV